MDNKEFLSEINIEDRMVAEFNKIFVPEGNTFSLSYPKKLDYAPNNESRFKNVATETILRSMDVVNFITHKIWESEAFREDHSWSRYLSQTSTDLKNILLDRDISDANLSSFNSNFTKRIRIWADPNFSLFDCNLLTEKMGIPFEKIWNRDPKIREQKIYAYEAELLIKNKQEEKKQSPSSMAEFTIDDGVYDSYRGGTEKDKPNIRELDLSIHSLLLSKSLVEDKRYPNLLIPAKNLDAKQANLVRRVFEILDNWRGSTPSGEFEFEAINASVERIFQQYDHGNIICPFFRLYQSYKDNPGFILELGVVLTEKTRKYLADSGKVRSRFRERARAVHSDVNSGKYLNESFQIINACNKILSSEDNFKKWLKGTDIFSI